MEFKSKTWQQVVVSVAVIAARTVAHWIDRDKDDRIERMQAEITSIKNSLAYRNG